MNYRHSYHAGNFADVVKHVILTALITSLIRKETPFYYIDTHAGPSYYDLWSEFAQKTKEYTGGIEKIIGYNHPPPLIRRYLECIYSINTELTGSKSTFASLRYYPGSPLIARKLLRPKDRLIACELQAEEYKALKTTFIGDKQVAVHHMDGFLGIKAFLPPPSRRGLVLIDPPYEDPDEYRHIVRALPVALKRFETGIYAIWYPIKEQITISRLHHALKMAIKRPVLAIALTIYPDLPKHLNGSGMLIVNPPWQFDELMEEILPWLWKALTINKQGGVDTCWLK